MHRCFVDPADWNDSEIMLSPPEEHHLLHVLRARTGDTVVVSDGRGREALARLLVRPAAGRAPRATLEVTEQICVIRPAISLMLIQALPKGKKMDFIIEKATELGVSTIFPVISERVVVRFPPKTDPFQTEKLCLMEERRERWQRIALSAARQCGTSWVPEIKPVSGYLDMIGGCGDFDLFIAGTLGAEAQPFQSVVAKMKKKGPQNIALLIGPEGDLTPAEVRKAMDAGAIPVSFGPLILRVETAALYGLSVLVYEFLALK